MFVSLTGLPLLGIGFALVSLIGIPTPLAAGAVFGLAMTFFGTF